MSKLEELIKKLCPNGMEYVKIESITNYEQPTPYIVKSTKYDDSYDIPVLTAGQTFILGYTNETNGVYNASKENPIIIFDDFTGAFKWVDFPFKVKSSAMKIIATNEKNVINRYLYHIMGYLNYTSNEHKRLWISIYSQIEIPLPPLEIQEEIVRILDSFIELTAELQAELQARRQQYEYYRDKLLTFGEDVERRILGELCVIGDGIHGTPEYDNNGDFYFINGNNLNHGQILINDNTKKVGLEMYKKYGVSLSDSTVLMSINGSIGNIAFYNNEKILLGKSVAYFSVNNNNLNNRYLFYYLQSQEAYNYYNYNLTGSTIKNLGLKNLRAFSIPLPSIEEQERIVSILDRFDKLCNDITTGLPAEIEARQKQYEYYRDKLLNFKEMDGKNKCDYLEF